MGPCMLASQSTLQAGEALESNIRGGLDGSRRPWQDSKTLLSLRLVLVHRLG